MPWSEYLGIDIAYYHLDRPTPADGRESLVTFPNFEEDAVALHPTKRYLAIGEGTSAVTIMDMTVRRKWVLQVKAKAIASGKEAIQGLDSLEGVADLQWDPLSENYLLCLYKSGTIIKVQDFEMLQTNDVFPITTIPTLST